LWFYITVHDIVRMNFNVTSNNYCNATQLNNLGTTFAGNLLQRNLFGIHRNKRNGSRCHPTQLVILIQQIRGLNR